MAAATTSLPETPGGERNWDYRYTWIRDSAFMLRALHDLGFDWEAFEYFAFLLDAVGRHAIEAATCELQIMYGIGGETDLTEHTLDHLSGYLRLATRCASATARSTSSSTTCGGCCSTRVGTHARRGGEMPARGVGGRSRASSRRRSPARPSPTRASGRCAARRSTSSRRR